MAFIVFFIVVVLKFSSQSNSREKAAILVMAGNSVRQELEAADYIIPAVRNTEQ